MTPPSASLSLDVHGARGSAAVSGAPFLRYGGNTTCYAAALPGGQYVIVDAGSGLGRFERALAHEGAGGLQATILLTHFHWDHIQGLPAFSLLYDSTAHLHFIGAPPEGYTIEEALDAVLRPPWFPVRFRDAPAKVTVQPLESSAISIGDLVVRGTALRHPGGVTGYRLERGGRALVIATDVEAGEAEHDAALRGLADGADVLIHDAQYLPEECRERYEGWGHSTWEHATAAARDAGVGRLVLTSHDPRRSDEEVDAIVEAARTRFPETTGAFEGMRIEL